MLSPDLANTTETELLELAKRGDQVAAQELFRRVAPDVDFVLTRMLRGRLSPFAEDIAADLRVSLSEKISSFNPSKASFRTWLLVVARRRAIDFMRKEAHRAPLQGDQLTQIPDVLAFEERSDTRDVIRQAINSLSPQQRAVLVARYLYGFSTDETARKLRISPNTVASHLQLACRQLRQLLKSHLTPP